MLQFDPCSPNDNTQYFPDQQRQMPIKPDSSSWKSNDFLQHYFSGNGAAVDLNDIGLLSEFRQTPSIQKIEADWKATVSNTIKAYLTQKTLNPNERRVLTLPHLLDATQSIDEGQWYVYHQDTLNPLNPIYAMGGGGLTATGTCTLIADANGHVEWHADLKFNGQDWYKDLTGTGFEPPGSTAYPINFSWESHLHTSNFPCSI